MEKVSVKSFVSRFMAGALIGLAAIAPGVSGGSIAVIFGLYQPITEAIADFWHDFWGKVKFFWPLCAGAAIGMLLFGRLVNYLFESYADFTCSLFVGLMCGTLPSVYKSAAKEGVRIRHLAAALICCALIVWLTTIEQIQYTGSSEQLSYGHMLMSGAILGLGSVLPGTSASFILIALGMYEPMLGALETFDIPRLLVLGVGFCSIVLLFARLVSYLFKKAYGFMSFATFGMTFGSIFNVLPSFSADLTSLFLILVIIGSAVGSFFLLKLKK